MSTQNIDFSKRIQKNTALGEETQKTEKNKKHSILYIVFLIGYISGMFSGYYFYKLKHLDENLVKYPDKLSEEEVPQNVEKNKSQKEFSNVSEKGSFIIQIGEFSPKRSSEIIKIIKKQKWEAEHFSTCIGLENYQAQSDDNQKIPIGIFRIPTNNGKYHKILMGCFHNQNIAFTILQKLKQLKQPEFTTSQIIQIEY